MINRTEALSLHEPFRKLVLNGASMVERQACADQWSLSSGVPSLSRTTVSLVAKNIRKSSLASQSPSWPSALEKAGQSMAQLTTGVKTPAQATEWQIPQSGCHWGTLGKSAPVKAPAHGGKWKRFQIGFDVHGDKQHTPSNEAFFSFAEQWNPDIRIMGGDLWDFRPLRHGANEDERRESMQSDYEAGMGWLIRFKPQWFLRGNHDERLWELAQYGVGVTGDFAREKVSHIEARMENLDVKMLRYEIRQGVLQLGHLKISHGFFNGIYCTKQMAEVYGSVLFGHNHVIQVHPVPGLERREARCCGALCQTIMPYNERRPTTLRHANGWAYGVLNESSGNFAVFQASEIDGTWILPTDTMEL